MTNVAPLSDSPPATASASWILPRLKPVTLTAAVIIYLVLAISVSLTRTPTDDDAFYVSAAYNLYAHGFTGTTIYEPAAYPFPGVEHRTYTYPPLYIVAQAAWYKLVGFGIFQVRLSSILWGLLVLTAWYVIVQRLLKNTAIATLAVFLLASDYTTIMTASMGRMTMMAAALAFGALAFYLSWRERNLGLALLLSNGCAMLAGLTHPLAGILAVANLIVLVVWLDRKQLKWSHVLPVLVPYVVGAVGWGLYIAKDVHLFWAQFSASAAQGRRLGGWTRPLTAIVSEVNDRYLGYYGYSPQKKDFRILLLLSYMVGAVFMLASQVIRLGRGYRILAVLTVVSFATMAFVEGTRQRVYMIHTISFLVVWLAAFVYWLWTRSRVRRLVAIGFAMMFLLLHVAAVAYRVRLNPYKKQYMPVVDYIRPAAQAGGLIFGPAPLRFALGYDSSVIFDPDLGAISGRVPALIVLDDQSRLTMHSQSETNPERHRRAEAVLERYQPVFSNGEYQVYAPKR